MEGQQQGYRPRLRLQVAASSDPAFEIFEIVIACLLAVLPGTRRKVGRDNRHEPIPDGVDVVGGQLSG